MNKEKLKWVYLLGASLIWGTMFLWTKRSLEGLSPMQVSTLRILTAGIIFFPIVLRRVLALPKKYYLYFLTTGTLGALFPLTLFAIAQQYIDSGITAVFTSVTPLFTLLVGYLFFTFPVNKYKIAGVILGMLSTVGLILVSSQAHPEQDYWYALLIIIASLSYGININLVKKWYQDIPALTFTGGVFIIILPIALLMFFSTGVKPQDFQNPIFMKGVAYAVFLGVTGSVIAKLMFNRLVQISTSVFASTFTYLVPLVAVIAGILDGEKLTLTQILFGILLLTAVYLTGKN